MESGGSRTIILIPRDCNRRCIIYVVSKRKCRPSTCSCGQAKSDYSLWMGLAQWRVSVGTEISPTEPQISFCPYDVKESPLVSTMTSRYSKSRQFDICSVPPITSNLVAS